MAIHFEGEVVFVNLVGPHALYGAFEEENYASEFFTAQIGSPKSRIVLIDNRPEILSIVRQIYDAKVPPFALNAHFESPAHVQIQEIDGVIKVQISPARDHPTTPWKYLYLGVTPSMNEIPDGSRTRFQHSVFLRIITTNWLEVLFANAFVKVVEVDNNTSMFRK